MGLARNVLLVVIATAATALAQAQGGGGQGGAGGGGPNGRFGNRQQFQQRFDERIKEMMQVSDAEWSALQPKIDNIRELQRGTFGGRGMFGRRGGRRGGADQAPDNQPAPPATPVEQKAQALQTLLDKKDAKAEDIKAALTAYREARAQARADLSKAQDDLRQFLTARQEAVLTMFGILE